MTVTPPASEGTDSASPTKTDPAPAGARTETSDAARLWGSEQAVLWLRRADQVFLGTVLITLIILLTLFRWRLSGGGQAEIEIVSQQPREYYYAIDINRASWVEWAQLEGIGEKLARRIVEDRQQFGLFRSVDDVSRVRGVGLKLLEKLRPFLKCHETSSNSNVDKQSSVPPQ